MSASWTIRCALLVITTSLASCVTPGPGNAGDSTSRSGFNPRIEYRSLVAAHPIIRAPAVDAAALDANETPRRDAGVAPTIPHGGTRPPIEAAAPVFIDFENESFTREISRMDLAALRTEYQKGKRFFVVGQSHGASAVGVHTLAVKRAQAVARAMIEHGIEPAAIHTLASWSNVRVPFAPSRGAQIFILEQSEDPSRALLALRGS